MTKETILCAFFRWVLYLRGTLFYADGRSNDVDLGRHSLGTTNYEEAKQQLINLDVRKAVEMGRADKAILRTAELPPLDLEEGCREYLIHVGRPQIVGGARK